MATVKQTVALILRHVRAQESRARLLRWAMDLSQQDQRRHAFRQELARACESLGVFVSA